jgi:hypothetical protein
MLYVYFPIRDKDLPDLNKLHALGKLGGLGFMTSETCINE